MGINLCSSFCSDGMNSGNSSVNRPIMTPRRIDSFDEKSKVSNKYIAELNSQDSTTDPISRLSEIRIQSNIFIGENVKKPTDYYERVSVIGVGGFGTVMKVRHIITKEFRAMKVIKKNEDDSGINNAAILEEIKILKSIDHPNIMKIYEFFQDANNFYLITEYSDGGDLYSILTHGDELSSHFSERVIRSIMRQVFSSLVYLHSKNIIHGDLKLENILLDSNNLSSVSKGDSNILEIKLIDFGCAKKLFKESQSSEYLEGTIFYMAPEVLIDGKINKKNDMWACGVMMYLLLTGKQPFEGNNEEETVEKIKKGKVNYNLPIFEEISKEAKDLLKLLLEFDIEKRIDAKFAMRHKWFQFQTKLQIDFNFKTNILKNLKCVRSESKLEQAVTSFITHNCIQKEEIQNLRKLFKVLDTDGDGRISIEELKKGFADSDLKETNFGDIDIELIMSIIDQDNNGYIEYEEFIKATLNKQNILTDSNLKQAFSQFDIDGNGWISADEIKTILGKGKYVHEVVINKVLEEVGLKPDEEINYEKFKEFMLKLASKSD